MSSGPGEFVAGTLARYPDHQSLPQFSALRFRQPRVLAAAHAAALRGCRVAGARQVLAAVSKIQGQLSAGPTRTTGALPYGALHVDEYVACPAFRDGRQRNIRLTDDIRRFFASEYDGMGAGHTPVIQQRHTDTAPGPIRIQRLCARHELSNQVRQGAVPNPEAFLSVADLNAHGREDTVRGDGAYSSM